MYYTLYTCTSSYSSNALLACYLQSPINESTLPVTTLPAAGVVVDIEVVSEEEEGDVASEVVVAVDTILTTNENKAICSIWYDIYVVWHDIVRMGHSNPFAGVAYIFVFGNKQQYLTNVWYVPELKCMFQKLLSPLAGNLQYVCRRSLFVCVYLETTLEGIRNNYSVCALISYFRRKKKKRNKYLKRKMNFVKCKRRNKKKRNKHENNDKSIIGTKLH